MIEIDGVVPVIPTPFAPDENIHEPDLRRLVKFAVTRGAAAICLPAYGSEFYKLSEDERERVVSIAIATNRRRVPLMAQANHASAAQAIRLAKTYERLGADVISVAIPRQFALGEKDVLRYLGRVADAISVPMMIQDFNPGGVTIGAALIDTLNKNHPNVRFVKLEEPLMTSKLLEIKRRVGERVGVLEGWGGYYMIELIPHKICGIMPGVPLLEPLCRIYRQAKSGDLRGAMAGLGQLLPFINYTLQDFELFLQVEKRLLVKRGLIESATLRDATYALSPEEERHVDLLLDHVMEVIGPNI